MEKAEQIPPGSLGTRALGGHLLCEKSSYTETSRLESMFGALSTVPAKLSLPAMLVKGLDMGMKKPPWMLVFQPPAAGVAQLRPH